MVTGSVVSSLQGEPRATHDVDLDIDIPRPFISQLLTIFPAPQYYYLKKQYKMPSPGKRCSTGNKADFWLLTDEPFDLSRFHRKIREELFGFSMVVSTPEDTILSKLRWMKLSGGSARQYVDALRVYEVQFDLLDISYLVAWAATLQVTEFLEQLIAEAKPL